MISTTVVMCENSLKNMDYQDHQDHPSEDTVSGCNDNLYANTRPTYHFLFQFNPRLNLNKLYRVVESKSDLIIVKNCV